MLALQVLQISDDEIAIDDDDCLDADTARQTRFAKHEGQSIRLNVMDMGKYIGESGRPLKFRLNEYRRALEISASYPNEAFSKHRTLKDTMQRPPSLKTKIFHRYLTNTLERKTMEAAEIKRRRPELNIKEKMRTCSRPIS